MQGVQEVETGVARQRECSRVRPLRQPGGDLDADQVPVTAQQVGHRIAAEIQMAVGELQLVARPRHGVAPCVDAQGCTAVGELHVHRPVDEGPHRGARPVRGRRDGHEPLRFDPMRQRMGPRVADIEAIGTIGR